MWPLFDGFVIRLKRVVSIRKLINDPVLQRKWKIVVSSNLMLGDLRLNLLPQIVIINSKFDSGYCNIILTERIQIKTQRGPKAITITRVSLNEKLNSKYFVKSYKLWKSDCCLKDQNMYFEIITIFNVSPKQKRDLEKYFLTFSGLHWSCQNHQIILVHSGF